VVALDLARLQATVDSPEAAGDAPPGRPLLPEASRVTTFELAEFGPAVGEVLVLAASIPGADGQSEVAIVSFSDGDARIAYYWVAGGNVEVSLEGEAPRQTVSVTAPFYGPLDSHAAPARLFHFVLAETDQRVQVIEDDRPWLGVYGSPADPSAPGPFSVLAIVPGSPADGLLRPGDTITSVEGDVFAHGTAVDTGCDVTHRLEEFLATSRVTLTVSRDGEELLVPIVLGSVIDSTAQALGAQSWYLYSEVPN
jgi:hypothetical protein